MFPRVTHPLPDAPESGVQVWTQRRQISLPTDHPHQHAIFTDSKLQSRGPAVRGKELDRAFPFHPPIIILHRQLLARIEGLRIRPYSVGQNGNLHLLHRQSQFGRLSAFERLQVAHRIVGPEFPRNPLGRAGIQTRWRDLGRLPPGNNVSPVDHRLFQRRSFPRDSQMICIRPLFLKSLDIIRFPRFKKLILRALGGKS